MVLVIHAFTDNSLREETIKFINYNNSTFSSKSELNILANSKIDIQMKPDVEDLSKFFQTTEGDNSYDQNMLKVISIDLSHFDSSKVTEMIYLFSGCKSLEYIDFTNFNTESLENMPFMFENCISLKSLDLSSFNTENIQDMSNIFQDVLL